MLDAEAKCSIMVINTVNVSVRAWILAPVVIIGFSEHKSVSINSKKEGRGFVSVRNRSAIDNTKHYTLKITIYTRGPDFARTNMDGQLSFQSQTPEV